MMILTTDLQSSLSHLDAKITEMRDHQMNADVKIDLLQNEVFNINGRETQSRKMLHGHGNNMLDETSAQPDDTDNDVRNILSYGP